MFNFLKNLFFLVLIILVFDYLLSVFFTTIRPIDYKIFVKAKREFFTKDIDYDTLIIGDSHISDSINTKILEKETHFKPFNLGIYSSSLFEHYFILDHILKNKSNQIKLVILGTSPQMFFREAIRSQYTSQIIENKYLEYKIQKNSTKGITADLLFRSMDEFYLLKQIQNSIIGKKYQPRRNIVSSYRGYLEFYNSLTEEFSINFDEIEEKKIVSIQIEYFYKIIKLLEEKNIKILIVNSPLQSNYYNSYSKHNNFKVFQKNIDYLVTKLNLKIVNKDYQVGLNILTNDDFLNKTHLNSSGAKFFTNYLVEYLLKNEIK